MEQGKTMDMIEKIVRLMAVLNKKFPFPYDLNPAAVNVDMFNRPNLPLMSSIVHYLLNIINPEKCSVVVPHPLSVQFNAQFARGVMKFLTQTFNELPHIKIGDLRPSTFAAASGERFIDFLARLVTNTVKLVYEKYGVVSVPSAVGIDSNVVLKIMQAKVDICTQECFQLRHPSAKKISDVPRHEEGLHKLKATRERQNAKYREMVSSCPSPYRELLKDSSPENGIEVLKSLQNDLKISYGQLTQERQTSQIWSDTIGERCERDVGCDVEPTRLEAGVLLNSMNEAVISKFADDQKIKLYEGSAVSLPGFLQCSSAIVEKLSTLIVTSKFKDSVDRASSDIETFIERWSEFSMEMSGLLSKTEDEITDLNNQCEEIQRQYDEQVAKGEITYRFFYTQPYPSPEINIPPFQASTDLALSPGNSWKNEVADVKRKFSSKERDISVHITPKRINNSSLSNLSRTVLQKQAWASGSRGADSTVGEMFQVPLSSSSPVNNTGGHAHVSSRKSLSDVIDDVSLLDAELNDFLADVSAMGDTADSSQLSTDDTFGDLPPLEVCQGNRRVGQPEAANPNPPHVPIRRARPSLDAIVKRYTTLRDRMKW